jgi:hypothetical protein
LGHYNMTNNCILNICGNNVVAGVVRRVSLGSENFEFVAIGKTYTKFTYAEPQTHRYMVSSMDQLHRVMTEKRDARVDLDFEQGEGIEMMSGTEEEMTRA